MTVTMLTGILVTGFGALYAFATFLMPLAAFGRPYEPKVFPYGLGVALVILGLFLILRAFGEQKKGKGKKVQFKIGNYEKKIAITVICCILYAILFNLLGYTFSTFLFITAEVLLFKGLKGWKVALLTGIAFSVTIYILFNKALGIYLPYSFLGWI